MTDKPSPRLDAIRALREATYEKSTAAQQEMARANAALAKRKKEDTMRELQEQASNAAARADAATDRRKAKKAAKSSRRGNPA